MIGSERYIGDLVKLLMFNGSSEYFPLVSNFLNEDEFKCIERYLLELPLEDITVGDAGEINNCLIERLMDDQPDEYPRKLNKILSTPILNSFKKRKAQSFLG